MIDLIITSDTSKIKYSGNYNSGYSDPHLVYAVTSLRKLKTIRNYKLREDFEYAPWQICRLLDDVDGTAWAWECMYKHIVGSHITTSKAKIPSESSTWMNSTIHKKLNGRYKLLMKAHKTPKGSVE